MNNKNSEAVEIIKTYLLASGIKPGDRIPIQAELSQTLGISARTLRDAINVLVNQGFLIPKGRAGTFMSNPRRESVVEPIRWFYEIREIPDYDLIEARLILERAIIVETCGNRTTKDLLLLQQIVDDESLPGIPKDIELKKDKEFHLQLINSAHNKALDIVGNVILLQLDLLNERGLYPDNDRIRSSDHQEIIDAVYRRDAEAAKSLIAMHIERCCHLANASLENPLGRNALIIPPEKI